MIIINLTIIVTLAEPEPLIHRSYAQTFRENDQVMREYRSSAHKIVCERCGWTEWYPTPGRAKMALSGHQKSCKRRREGS